jgi:hypothetical protein
MDSHEESAHSQSKWLSRPTIGWRRVRGVPRQILFIAPWESERLFAGTVA